MKPINTVLRDSERRSVSKVNITLGSKHYS